MKFFLFVFLSFLIFVFSAAAQTEQNNTPKIVAGGIVNGKAKTLAKPVYPPAARAVNAGGAVNVQITIDENGDVISATAVSGHPLLRQAATEAARQAKFAPTVLSGQPVKVTGIIVYNFVPPSSNKLYVSNWFQTGNTLANLDKPPSLRYIEPDAIMQMIPANWEAERQQLERLKELKKNEFDSVSGNFPKERVIGEQTNKTSDNSSVSKTVITTSTAPPVKQISEETSAIGQSLINSIQGRLAGNSLDLWYFNLGINVNHALLGADSRSRQIRMDSVKPFRDFIATAQPEITRELIEELNKMASLMEKGVFTDEDKIVLSQSLTKLNLLSINR